MPAKLNQSTRQRIISLLGDGHSIRSISRDTGAARATIKGIQDELLLAEDPSARIPGTSPAAKRRAAATVASADGAQSGRIRGKQCIVFGLRLVVPVEQANLQAAFDALDGSDRRLDVVSSEVFTGSLDQWDATHAGGSLPKPATRLLPPSRKSLASPDAE